MKKPILLYIGGVLAQAATFLAIMFISSFNKHDSFNGLQAIFAFVLAGILVVIFGLFLLISGAICLYQWIQTSKVSLKISPGFYKASLIFVWTGLFIDLLLIIDTISGTSGY